MPDSVLSPRLENNEEGPVVIITSQFLSEKHAPTRRVLDYASTMSRVFGKKVVIINDAGMNFEIYDYMENSVGFNYMAELESVYSITYGGEKFAFYQNKYKMLDFQEIANMLYNIRQLKPSLVLNVGQNSILSDLCTCFVKTATIPCSTSIPISLAENLIVCRDVRDSDWERINKIEPWQNVISSVFNYIMPAESQMKHYTREQFNIPDDAWVIVSAGNRMEKEITNEFLEAVDQMLSVIEEAVFLIVGTYTNRNKINSIMKNNNRVIYAGNVEDGSQLIRLADVYIQPRRKGGGRAAFEALYYGVPVALLKYGDAWDVSGPEFEVDSYEDMVQTISTYYSNSEVYHDMVKKSLKRGKTLEDMPSMFKELFDDLNMKYEIKISNVNTNKFHSIFKTEEDIRSEKYSRLAKKIEKEIYTIKEYVKWNERKLRTNEWATVFNSTIRGVDWMENLSLSPGRCAIDYPGLYTMYRVLDEIRPDRILEIGLGQSTKIIGAYAEKYNATHFIVEHDRDWINFFFSKHNKNEKTEIVNLDRVEEKFSGRYIETRTPIYHYKNFSERLRGQKFEFIFIDGPQGSKEYSRVDITELLPEILDENFIIMVDDSQREGETRTINKILKILTDNSIDWMAADCDGQKYTIIIVSKSYKFLCSL